MTRKVVWDDQDEKMGQDVEFDRFWRETSRNHSKDVFERTVLYERIYKSQNAPWIVFNFTDFLSVKQELICDKKQFDVKMKFGLIAQH